MKTYLNFGCGDKFDSSWTNVDQYAGPGTVQHKLPKPFPFSSASFEVVYSSHVLEHFARDEARKVIAECFRILRPGGVLRLVVPDLEDVAREYLRVLERVRHTSRADRQYEWISIELLDQYVREEHGGEMRNYLMREGHGDEYVAGRIGAAEACGRDHRSEEARLARVLRLGTAELLARVVAKVYGLAVVALLRCLPGPEFEAWRLGRFRRSGEVHRWMYDEYSLGRLLQDSGFVDVARRDPHTSYIHNWQAYGLDGGNGTAYRPHSLIVEALKPH